MQFDMVFEGGGAKGMVFVGAMEEFNRRGHSHGRLLGTSAGAITAALLAAGYSTDEMLTALAEQTGEGHPVFTTFMGQPGPLSAEALQEGALARVLKEIDLPFLPNAFGIEEKFDAGLLKLISGNAIGRHLLSFIERGGWFAADAFVEWMSKKLDSGTLDGKQPRAFSRMTMKEFNAVTGSDLSLVAANVTKGIKLVLNHRTAPDVPVVWAVRMSMSIPLLWQEVTWRAEWGQYRGLDLTGDAIVDGGLLSNFPIELFISDQKPVQAVMGEKVSERVLGLLIDESVDVPNAPALPPKTGAPAKKKPAVEVGELSTVQRLMNLVNTMLEARDKDVISAFEELVVRLPAGGYGTTEFDMTEERRAALLEAGRITMKRYLDRLEMKSVSFSFDEGPTPAELADQTALRMLLK